MCVSQEPLGQLVKNKPMYTVCSSSMCSLKHKLHTSECTMQLSYQMHHADLTVASIPSNLESKPAIPLLLSSPPSPRSGQNPAAKWFVVHLELKTALLMIAICKVQVKSSTCYSASYMRRTQDQKRYTILEVAADWHELMIPQCTVQPSIARMNEQLDPRFAASRHTISRISHTRPSPCSP